jgi:SNF2 family DNA or RNA helicase
VVDRFQEDPKIRMIIAPIKIGYVGYNMTEANQVIFAEMDWVPSVHDQAEDRALRIGQKKNVSAWYLYAAGTIEEKMIAILEGKRSIITRATDGSATGDESKAMMGELLVRLGADNGEEERFLVADRLREYLASNRKN